MIDKSNNTHVIVNQLAINRYKIPQVDQRIRTGYAMLTALKEAVGVGVYTGHKIEDGQVTGRIWVDTYNKTWGDWIDWDHFLARRDEVDAAIARVNANV